MNQRPGTTPHWLADFDLLVWACGFGFNLRTGEFYIGLGPLYIGRVFS